MLPAQQLVISGAAQRGIDAIEAQAVARMHEVWAEWLEASEHTDVQVRFRMENVVRTAYRAAAQLAVSQMRDQVREFLPDWNPETRIFRTSYLDALLEDVRRNLREYKADRTVLARRRAALRMELSARVASQRGYTDALLSLAGELDDAKLQVRKTWQATFINNTPCPQCTELHGVSVPLGSSFPGTGSVYIDLLGPPLHPRCRCKLVILVSQTGVPEAAMGEIPASVTEQSERSMSAADVRAMPKKAYDAFLRFLRAFRRRAAG